MIVKGAAAIEALGSVRAVLLDKTGTVTLGVPTVERIVPLNGRSEAEILRLAASLDQVSLHGVATSLVAAAAQDGLALEMPYDTEEGVGEGIAGRVGACRVAVGSPAFLRSRGIADLPDTAALGVEDDSARVFVAVNGEVEGVVVMSDDLRVDAGGLVDRLHRSGVRHVAIVSGDRAGVTERIGRQLEVDAVHAGLSPSEKLDVCATVRAADWGGPWPWSVTVSTMRPPWPARMWGSLWVLGAVRLRPRQPMS